MDLLDLPIPMWAEGESPKTAMLDGKPTSEPKFSIKYCWRSGRNFRQTIRHALQSGEPHAQEAVFQVQNGSEWVDRRRLHEAAAKLWHSG